MSVFCGVREEVFPVRSGARSLVACALLSCALAACSVPAARSGSSSLGTCAEQPGGCAAAVGNNTPIACPAPQQACFGACFDLGTSAQHCGLCGNACAPGDVCEAGVCRDVCGGELGLCAGQCVSLTSDANHCGACETACTPGQACTGGVCGACVETLCPVGTATVCAALGSDPNHCGACNNVCAQGQLCKDARCVLDCGALTDCNGACVDLLSNPTSCGACGAACPAGEACVDGMCACAAGLTDCSGACVDTAQDPMHCGACGHACAGADHCEAGRCVGPDGCSDTPVAGLSLSEIAVYQAVKIPIMQNQSAIAADERNADVVQGRDAVFRVHVTPAADWTPRAVSARLELSDPAEQGGTQLFFAQLVPSAASSDDDPASTFQIAVPPEALTAGASYAVSLVECDAAAPIGLTDGARFPTVGLAELQARETGPLRVHLLPIDSGGGPPDVTMEALETYRTRLYAVFPVTSVELTVGETLVNAASSMCDHLAAVRSRRSADAAPVDLYYFGLTDGTAGGESGCSTASPNAATSGKTSAGWASGYGQLETGAATMCHELGHAHGRQHAPCQVQDPDPSYPYPNADIGVWAHDLRSDEFLPPTSKDMMSYCPNPDRFRAWLSDYTYQALVDRVAEVNALAKGARIVRSSEPEEAWRLLVVDAEGARFSPHRLLVQGTPEGEPIRAVVHDRNGPMQSIEVYRERLEDGRDGGAWLLTVPEPESSDWYALEVPGLVALQPF